MQYLFSERTDNDENFQSPYRGSAGISDTAGNALLCGQVIACVRLFRGMENDFGLFLRRNTMKLRHSTTRM